RSRPRGGPGKAGLAATLDAVRRPISRLHLPAASLAGESAPTTLRCRPWKYGTPAASELRNTELDKATDRPCGGLRVAAWTGTSAAPGEWGSAATSQSARRPPGHETVLLISARRAGCTEESIRYEICYC